MAKNYTMKEAVAIIAEGKDMEAITDIGRRYPVLLHKVTVVATKAGEDFVDLMKFMPDYLTANKVNSIIKTGVVGNADAGDAEDTDQEATDATDNAEEEVETENAGETDYESMSAKQLWDILGKAGLRKTAKSTKKSDLVAACIAMDEAKAAGTPVEEDEAIEDEAESTNPYEGKTAMELFKECKKRGIKAEAKKPAKFYADLLLKDDASKDAATDSEDDWEEEEQPTPTKEEKKPKKAKAAAKKAEPEDDGDDWDI